MSYSWQITSFSGEYRFLSNFYPVDIIWEEEYFTCSEQVYMYQKCALESDRKKILSFSKAADIKRVGRQVQLVDGWDSGLRDKAMMNALKAKFENRTLRGCLRMTTGALLVEGNTWGDTYWGVCNGVGQNKLGRMLMWLRDKYYHQEFEDIPY